MSFKSGFVAVVGVPNAGKSTLVNTLVGEKVSIVTSKPQTTRKRHLGILNTEVGQAVFVDTPGVTDSKEGLNPFLRRELSLALSEVDVVLGLVGPWEFKTKDKPWVVETLLPMSDTKRIIFVSSQVVRIPRERRADMAPTWDSWTGGGVPLHYISALEGHGLLELKEAIFSTLPEGPKYYDPEIYTTQTMREIAAEVIREKCFEFLHQEVPYGLGVHIQKFEEKEGQIRIKADIVVERDTHKGMVIGKGGQSLKRIGQDARLELEKNFSARVHLETFVLVKDSWTKRPDLMQEMGYQHV